MTVILSRHAMEKLTKELSKLNVTEGLVREIVDNPEETLYDTLTGRYVALKTGRNLAVVYERRGGDMFIITVIYSSRLEDMVQRRRKSGRWI